MELNALEMLIEDKEKHYLARLNEKLPDNLNATTSVTWGDLRAFAKEHRELEQRFQQRGDRLFESSKMITVRDERIKELESLLKAYESKAKTDKEDDTNTLNELQRRGNIIVKLNERIKELEAKLAQRKGERCENCSHNEQPTTFRPDTHIQCSKFGDNMPKKACCPHYTAKPKVRKCRWKIELITPRCFTEEEARRKWNDRLIGPVEGTWEEE